MDFHTLSRKELQALCKKNKIPANMTNVAMAGALAALQHVEGLDELLNSVESDAQQFQEEKVVGTPDVHRTACRTLTRRSSVKDQPEGSKLSTHRCRGTRADAEAIDQDNKNLNVPVTPAMPSSRRRAPSISISRKKETQKPEDEKNGCQDKATDMPKTPAAPSSRVRAAGRSACNKLATPDGTTVQRACNTRRSVRLLEKNMAKMSLIDTEDTNALKIDEISEDMIIVSQQIDDSEETENGASLQTLSIVSEKTDELEITSQKKNVEYECQSHDTKSDAHMIKTTGKGVDVNYEEGTTLHKIESSCDSPKPENKKSPGANDALLVEVFDGAFGQVTREEVAGLAPVSCENYDSVSLEDKVLCNNDNKESAHCDVLDSNDIHNSELMFDAEREVDGMDLASPEGAIDGSSNLCSFGEQHDYLEDNTDALLVGSEILEGEPDKDADKLQGEPGKDAATLEGEPEKDSEKTVNISDVTSPLISFLALEKDPSSEISMDDPEKDAQKTVNISDVTSPLTSFLALEKDPSSEISMEEPEKDAAKLEEPEKDAAKLEEPEKDAERTVNISDVTSLLTSFLSLQKDAEPETSLFPIDINESKEHAAAEETVFNSTSLDDQKDSSGKSEAKAEPEITLVPNCMDKSKENAAAEFSCDSELKDGNYIVSYDSHALISVLNCNTNMESDVIPEETAITKLELDETTDETMKRRSPSLNVSVGNVNDMRVALIQEQNDIPIQSNVVEQLQSKGDFTCPPQSESKDNVKENQTVQNICFQDDEDPEIYKMKENLKTDELQNKSMRELKKMLKKLTLDGKTNSNLQDGAKVKQEVENKRTALQALPENRIPAGESENDGLII